MAGDGVFFKRVDIFRGKLTKKMGITYSAYGENDNGIVDGKSKLYGSLGDYSESAFWDATDKANVYVSKEKFDKEWDSLFLTVESHGL